MNKNTVVLRKKPGSNTVLSTFRIFEVRHRSFAAQNFYPFNQTRVMNNDRTNNRPDPNDRDMTENRLEQNSSVPNDLPDSPRDQEKLRNEETYIDLPDVKDIPGQEFINTAPVGSMADTTISSADEEGTNVFDRDDSQDLRIRGNDSDVSRGEKIALQQIDYMPTTDEDNLANARMDSVDFQNEPLNEKSFGEERSGDDLDVPGSELDDAMEQIGEEDEENNDYSLGSADNDNVTEGTP